MSNVILYVLYLLLTMTGVGHKTSMTLLFVVGVLQSFVVHKRWTFSHQGFFQSTFIRYGSVYGLAYLLNLSALMLFVDSLSLPHEIVQGVMILLVALLLFFVQRHWVFRVPNHLSGAE